MDPPPVRLGVVYLDRADDSTGSCWIPGSWDVPMLYNPIVVTLASLKPFFFNGLQKELCFPNNAWSIRPRNPIRTTANYLVYDERIAHACTNCSVPWHNPYRDTRRSPRGTRPCRCSG